MDGKPQKDKADILLKKLASFLAKSKQDRYSGTISIGVSMKQGGIMNATVTPQYFMDLSEP